MIQNEGWTSVHNFKRIQNVKAYKIMKKDTKFRRYKIIKDTKLQSCTIIKDTQLKRCKIIKELEV